VADAVIEAETSSGFSLLIAQWRLRMAWFPKPLTVSNSLLWLEMITSRSVFNPALCSPFATKPGNTKTSSQG